MKLFCLTLVLFFCYNLNGQRVLNVDSVRLKRGIDTKNMYGDLDKVKKVRQTSFSFFNEKKKLEKSNLDDYSIMITKYDKNGNAINVTSKSKYKDRKSKTEATYYYENNQLKQEKVVTNGELRTNQKITYKINKDSLITYHQTLDSLNSNLSLSYAQYQIFNKDFYVISEGTINSPSKTNFFYDDKNRLIKEVFHSDNLVSNDSYEKEYFYDDSNQLISTILTLETITNKIDFEFDASGKVIRSRNSLISKEGETEITVEFEYNKKGDWVKMKNLRNGKVTKRKICYH